MLLVVSDAPAACLLSDQKPLVPDAYRDPGVSGVIHFDLRDGFNEHLQPRLCLTPLGVFLCALHAGELLAGSRDEKRFPSRSFRVLSVSIVSSSARQSLPTSISVLVSYSEPSVLTRIPWPPSTEPPTIVPFAVITSIVPLTRTSLCKIWAAATKLPPHRTEVSCRNEQSKFASHRTVPRFFPTTPSPTSIDPFASRFATPTDPGEEPAEFPGACLMRIVEREVGLGRGLLWH